MRLRIALWGVFALPLIGGATLHAQTTQPSTEQRLQQLERRLDQMEQKHQAELRQRDEEIARLKDQLGSRPATAPTDEIEKTRQDILKDIESREAVTPTVRLPANFNPDIAIISDFAGSASTLNSNPARNRFDIREVELDIRAAVDPRADGVLIAPIAREVEDPWARLFRLLHCVKLSDDAIAVTLDAIELANRMNRVSQSSTCLPAPMMHSLL